MKFRKSALVASAAALALLATGCGTTASNPTSTGSGSASAAPMEKVDYKIEDVVKPKDGKKLKIGVSFPKSDDQFLQNVSDAMKERATAAGVELQVVDAQNKPDQQLNQVQNFLTQNYDGVIVVPVDAESVKPITDMVTGKKVPLVYVNRMPSHLPSGVVYAGSDSKQAGILQMEALAKLVGGKGNVGILQGPPGEEAPRERTAGCKEVIAKHPEMKVAVEGTASWMREKGLQVAENWIQGGNNLVAICSNNDDMALGAITAYKNAGKLKDVKIGGVDATADGLKSMQEGELAVTVFQDGKGQGYAGVDSIIKLHNGDKVPSFLNVPFQLVTPENIKEFLDKNKH